MKGYWHFAALVFCVSNVIAIKTAQAVGASDTALLFGRMIAFLDEKQIKTSENHRETGFWKSSIVNQDNGQTFQDVNAFVALHTMITLREINELLPIPQIENIKDVFAIQLSKYFEDAHLLLPRSGTINFWPRIYTLGDGWVHHFTTDDALRKATGIPDLRNDFDDSALAAAWLVLQESKVSEDFIDASSLMTDKVSGGFLTWLSPLGTKNNVDCVVNINVLQAYALHEKMNFSLAPLAREAKLHSLNYLQNIVARDGTHNCATFYDRSSQFYVALARLFHRDPSYLNGFYDEAIKDLEAKILVHLQSDNATELSEYLLALKLMTQTQRTCEQEQVIESLTEKVLNKIETNGSMAYVKSGSQFRGQHLHWYSDAMSTAFALHALIEP